MTCEESSEQRKLLLPYYKETKNYKEAKKNKKKTIWKALDGNYTLLKKAAIMDSAFFILLNKH